MQGPRTYTVDEAHKALEHYCAYQERCHLEVQKKLQSMGMIPIAIDTIINRLIEDNYLNETRFAMAFARGKFKIKKWGRQRITRELKMRDISAYNIKVALQEISEDDYQKTLYALAEKRCAAIKETNSFKKKKKLVDYLLYRGWESHLVYEVVSELVDG
ncbi:RecX family transcriptional regulator [Paucihalobacter ruber]|uniref:Regulatory protein RecX n=1 Tax=Paucihalobacter ruber TaxID=2567861 RepID=A0A506PNF3_9FLAO|nr:regulatory protein RecX [Paucihalobacter ruber]TPV34745.1 RecX family transcriptional regulator [Paucihalobacter ruber]